MLPALGMAERTEQVSLSHLMLDSMLDGSIALCDAGTGIGKTYSYLAAGAAFLCFQAASGLKFRPIIVSTSSIALQNAVQDEYLPLLSDVLMESGMTERPEQVSLSHLMLDSMLDGSIALCDAGTGIGKTYSYLAAGAAFLYFQAASGLKFRPIIVSTSSIALHDVIYKGWFTPPQITS